MLKAAAELTFLPATFAVIDVETTGLKAHKEDIIEVAGIKVDRDTGTFTTFEVLVQRPSKEPLPDIIVDLTGITDAMLAADGREAGAVLRRFMGFLADAHIVAYNARFDTAFILEALRRHQISGFQLRDVSCALAMARRAWPGLPRHRLVDVARHVDPSIDTEGAHRALDDCRLALVTYLAAARRLQTAI